MLRRGEFMAGVLTGGAIVLLAWVLSSRATAAEFSANEKQCAVAALTDYNRANLALLPISSIEATIAQRRLQEGYCVRFARCIASGSTPLWAMFSKCLEDEALEKYEAVKR